MPTYRIYLMDPFTGHIERTEEYEAADDASAEKLATLYLADYPIELWCENRKIRRFETPRSETIARLQQRRPADEEWMHRGRC